MPIPSRGFHMIKEVRDGAPQDGLAMYEDPVTGVVQGVEYCPDCAWDCIPAQESPCAESTCGTGLDRPLTVKLVLTIARADDASCTWDNNPDACGEQFDFDRNNPCACANGTWILTGDNTGQGATDSCDYSITVTQPPYDNGCENPSPFQAFFSIGAVGDSFVFRLRVDPGGTVIQVWEKTVSTPLDCMTFAVSFGDGDRVGGPPHNCSGAASVS